MKNIFYIFLFFITALIYMLPIFVIQMTAIIVRAFSGYNLTNHEYVDIFLTPLHKLEHKIKWKNTK